MKKVKKVLLTLLPSLFTLGLLIPLAASSAPIKDEAGEDTALYSDDGDLVAPYDEKQFAAEDDDDEDEPFIQPQKVILHYYNEAGVIGGQKGQSRAFYIWATGVDGIEISQYENSDYFSVNDAKNMMTLSFDYDDPTFLPFKGHPSLYFIIKFEKKSASDENWGGQSEDMQLSFRTYPPVDGLTQVWTMPAAGGGIAIVDKYEKTQVHGIKLAEFKDWKTIYCEVTNNTFNVNWKLYAFDQTYFKVKAKDRAAIEQYYLVKQGSSAGSSFEINLKYEVHINVVYTLVSHDPSSDSDPEMAQFDKTVGVSFENLYYTAKFNKYYEAPHEGATLGMTYTSSGTTFRVWSPVSANMKVLLYADGTPTEFSDATHPGDDRSVSFPMNYKSGGIWELTIREDDEVAQEKIDKKLGSRGLKGKYYNLQVDNSLGTNVTMDPYATSSGVNGVRGFIYDKNSNEVKPDQVEEWNYLSTHHFPAPEGKTEDKFTPQDLSIYEVHVQDFTSDDSWVSNKGNARGTYNAFVEDGTKLASDNSLVTGFDHLNKLGVNAVQLTPVFDHDNDERPSHMKYNWGYNPLNYNIVEGGYSSDPFNGATRVKEFRNLVLQLSKTDVKTRVIMDVVYNHVSSASASCFNKLMPRYYFRYCRADYTYEWYDEHGNKQYSTVYKGTMWDGSGCNNEVATERPMMRKFIVDSLCMWARDYNIKGFRFDLMGLIDVQTLKKAQTKLYDIDPTIYMYGECWTGSGYDNGDGYHGEGSNEWKAANPGAPDPNNFGAFRWQVFNQCNPKTTSEFPDGKAVYLGAFNDKTRDALRGSNNEGGYPGKGMLQLGNMTAPYGDHNMVEDIARGLWGNNHSDVTWGWNPEQNVNYASCHDNWTVRDQLYNTIQDGSPASIYDLVRGSILTHTLMFSANTPAFIQGGEELFRTKELDIRKQKPGESDEDYYKFVEAEMAKLNIKPSDTAKLHGHWISHNSYNTPAYVNAFKWENKKTLTVDGTSIENFDSTWGITNTFEKMIKMHAKLAKKRGGDKNFGYDDLMKTTSGGSSVINPVWDIHGDDSGKICSMQVNEVFVYFEAGNYYENHGIAQAAGNGTWPFQLGYGYDGATNPHEYDGNYWIEFNSKFGFAIYDGQGKLS